METGAGKKTWRRRNYFIDKGFQTRFVMRFLAVVMAGSAMSGYVMYERISATTERALYSSHVKLASAGALVLPDILGVNMGAASVVLLAVAAITLVLSHRIAGPMYRMERSLEDMAGDDLTGNFRLRSADELKGLSESLERMGGGLRERFDGLREQAGEVDRAACSLLDFYERTLYDPSGRDTEQERRRISELAARADEFGKAMSGFKLRKAG